MRAEGQPPLRLNALRIEQRAGAPLYVFGIDGRRIPHFAAVDGARRGKSGVLEGYQRERVRSHINQIYQYLKSDGALLPNAIIVALTQPMAFDPMPAIVASEWGTPGVLKIPLPSKGVPRQAQVVDGQQRVTALAMLEASEPFPVVVVAFEAVSDALRREQFVLVNRTKPLPRDLLNELLPHVDGALPPAMTLRRTSGQVLELLRFDQTSPFFGRVRGLGISGEGCNIAQASVLGVIEASVRQGGVLADAYYRREEPDVGEMALIVKLFFTAVRKVWPLAWESSPWTSRLVHGVGMAGLGRLMDVVMAEVDPHAARALGSVERRLRRISDQCAWTSGSWPVLNCDWNDLENTGRDKRRLATYLCEIYTNAS